MKERTGIRTRWGVERSRGSAVVQTRHIPDSPGEIMATYTTVQARFWPKTVQARFWPFFR